MNAYTSYNQYIDEYSKNRCFCKSHFDVRCCCTPNDKSWTKCPMKASTAWFLMMNNDADICNHIQEKGFRGIKQILSKQYKLDKKDWQQIMEWYEDEKQYY